MTEGNSRRRDNRPEKPIEPPSPHTTRREVLKGAAVVAGLAAFARMQIGGMEDHVAAATARGTLYLRPPGAVDEAEFVRRCIRCHRCGENCSNSCIRFVGPEGPPDARGTPYIVPREKACILCMKCNNNCPSGALRPIDPADAAIWRVADMGIAQLDRNICHSYQGYVCGICVRACPLMGKALRAGLWEKPILDPDYCVGCGLCEQACVHMPQAIRVRPSLRREVKT